MTSTWIDAAFPLRGATLPLDHGYALFGAVARLVPALHEDRSVGLHPVRGRRSGPGILALTRASELTIRLRAEQIASMLPLAGARLEVDGHRVSVGPPRVRSLIPSPRLYSRFVTIKGYHADPAAFTKVAQEKLEALDPALATAGFHAGERRVIKIATHTIVGFPVEVDGLSAEASLALQVAGLGGRRHMGAGVFGQRS